MSSPARPPVRARPAWLIQVGELVLLDGRATEVFGTRWVNTGHRRRRRLYVHDHDGKPKYEDFRAGEWVEVIPVP